MSEARSQGYARVTSFRGWLQERKDRPKLPSFDVELTERCNSNCIHCYINLPADDERAQRAELGTESVKRVLGEAAALGALAVRLTGGEPLLRADFDEIYLHARRLGLRVIIFTNARLVTESRALLFAQVPPLEKIEVSVYGMSARSYDAVARSPGAFAEFRRGVGLLVEHRVPFVLKWVPLPPNKHESEAFDRWVSSSPGLERAAAAVSTFDLRARRDDVARNAVIERIRRAARVPDAPIALPTLDARKEAASFCSQFAGPPGPELFRCGAGKSCTMDAYGNLQPCLQLRHPDTRVSVAESTLESALSEFFPRMRQMRATDGSYLERCARCFLKGLCEQCPAKSWMEGGTLDRPVEYLCAAAHSEARQLGLVGPGENAWEVEDWEARLGKLADER